MLADISSVVAAASSSSNETSDNIESICSLLEHISLLLNLTSLIVEFNVSTPLFKDSTTCPNSLFFLAFPLYDKLYEDNSDEYCFTLFISADKYLLIKIEITMPTIMNIIVKTTCCIAISTTPLNTSFSEATRHIDHGVLLTCAWEIKILEFSTLSSSTDALLEIIFFKISCNFSLSTLSELLL